MGRCPDIRDKSIVCKGGWEYATPVQETYSAAGIEKPAVFVPLPPGSGLRRAEEGAR